MLLVIELMFLATGLWAVVSGRLPASLFRLLFGKGEYELPPPRARLYGILLASPLPAALSASFLLAALLGERAIGVTIAVEYLYLLAVIIASIVIARRIRRPLEVGLPQSSPEAGSEPRRPRSYATRLLIILGLALLSCIVPVSVFTLIVTVVSTLRYGTRITGDFSQDILPFILLVAVIGLGLFAGLKLIRLLRT